MDWHSTRHREELLIVLAGAVQVEHGDGRRALRLSAFQCAFIPSRTRHCVVNRSRRPAHYLYITG